MLKSTLKLRSLPSLWRKSPFLAAPSSISCLNTVPNPYKSLHESFPKYYFNNGAFQGHGQNQAGSPHKTSIAGPFNEKSFMVHFLHLAQHRGGHSKEELVETFKVLRANVDKLQNPSSVVGLIHKLQIFNEYIDEELRNKILDQATKVFLRQYSANDQGDLLRAVILVAAVQKINHDKFYKTLFSIVLAKLENISFFNLLTILESYTYNKRLFQAGSVDEVTKILKSLSNYLQIRELGNFSKYSTLLSYLARTVQYLGPNAKDSEAIKAEILKNVNKLYDVILQMIVNDRGSKSMDIFGLTDVFISLDAFNPIYPNLKEKYGLLQRHYGSLIELYLPKGFQLSNVKYNLGTVIPFLKRHYVAPPSYVHPQFASLINQIFLKHSQDKDREFHNLETYVYFLLFLAKTDSLNIPEAIAKDMKLEELIIQERNLFYLAKALEFFALCEQAGKNYFSPEKKEIDRLEKAIFHIIGRLPKKGIVSPSLLQIFQLLVALNKGSNEDWKNLLTLFSDKENLKNLDHLEFIIKLVPAGAVKTKNLYKVYSNISITGAAHRLKGAQPDPEVAQLLEKFWNTVEEILVNRANEIYPDKYPIILFNFVYANLIKDTYKKVYKIAKPKLINNLHLLSPKQLSEIIYSYSRVEEEADELMFAVAREVLNKKLYEQMDSTALSNLYWGYTNAGIWVEELSRKLEERMFANLKDMPMETYIQFCYALARNNRQLEASEQEKLNNYTLKVLKEYSGPSKSFNIQNVIGICSSFNVLRNYDAKVWEEIINFLLQKKYFYQDSILLLYYIYVLYIHLTIEKLPITNRGDLFQVIQDNHRNIMEHMIANKKHQRSLFETQIRDIISNNMTEIFGPDAQFKQDDEPLMLYRGPEHDFILVNDMGKVKDLIKQKKLTRLGVRELLIPYTVDIIVDNYAIEVNGPSHYMKAEDKSIKEHGYSSMKANFLKKLGMTYIEIPYFINDELDPENEKRIIKSIKDQIEKSKKEN